MNFSDAAKYSMIEFHSLYPTFGQYLDHLFMVIGNGMEWGNGSLGDNEHHRSAELPSLERLVARGVTQQAPNLPDWLNYPLRIKKYATDIPLRITDPAIKSCYGFSEYSRIGHIPDDISPDWLSACVLYLLIVGQTPIENFMRYTNKDLLAGAEKDFETTQTKCKEILTSLYKRFPDHVFQNPIKTITFDPDRSDVPGYGKYWPLDDSPVADVNDLIEPFKDALKFAYNIKPKPGASLEDLDSIFEQIAAHAIEFGKKILAREVRKNSEWGNGKDLEMLLADRPDHTITWNGDTVIGGGTVRYDCTCGWTGATTSSCDEHNDHHAQIRAANIEAIKNRVEPYQTVLDRYPAEERRYMDDVAPFMKTIRKKLKLSRKNLKKDIPYVGYPNGRSVRAGCFEPNERFMAERMEYDLYDQGRDALEVIIGSMITCLSEQGARLIKSEFIAAYKDFTPPTRNNNLTKHPWKCIDDYESSENAYKSRSTPEVLAKLNAVIDSFDGKRLGDFDAPPQKSGFVVDLAI